MVSAPEDGLIINIINIYISSIFPGRFAFLYMAVSPYKGSETGTEYKTWL